MEFLIEFFIANYYQIVNDSCWVFEILLRTDNNLFGGNCHVRTCLMFELQWHQESSLFTFYSAALDFLSSKLLSFAQIFSQIVYFPQQKLIYYFEICNNNKTHTRKKATSSFKLRIGERHAIQITTIWISVYDSKCDHMLYTALYWCDIVYTRINFNAQLFHQQDEHFTWNTWSEFCNLMLGHVRNCRHYRSISVQVNHTATKNIYR